jgi:type IV pilus assembly protein PilY1
MTQRKTRYTATLAGIFVALASGMPALADDSEIYLAPVSAAQLVKPNVLLVMDTSISMQAEVMEEVGPYNPAYQYPNLGGSNGCRDDRLYWVDASSADPGDTGAPNCLTGTRTTQWINPSANKCSQSFTALANNGTWYDPNDKLAHWRGGSSKTWGDLRTTNNSANSAPVECQLDQGVHGDTNASTNRYIRQNSTCGSGDTTGCYSNAASYGNWGSRKRYRLYSGRYLNWLHSPGIPSGQTRIEVAIDAAKSMVDSSNSMRIGLMQMSRRGPGTWPALRDIDDDGEGGMVLKEIADVATNGTSIKAAIDALDASTYTTSAETFYEATQYFRGGAVEYGLTSGLYDGGFTSKPSVAASRKPSPNQNEYLSPMQYKCQRNYMIFISDGVPRGDRTVEAPTNRVNALPGWNAAVGQSGCDGDVDGPSGYGDPDGGGRCLDDIAEYLANADLNTTLDGKQNVITYTVGFSEEVDGEDFLKEVADDSYDKADTSEDAPKGQFFQANTSIQLNEVLKSIKIEMEKRNASFTSPTVSVDAFNRTRNNDKIYMSVFQTDTIDRWHGNLKKYKIANQVLVDQNGAGAVDTVSGSATEGKFKSTAQSYWSETVDGGNAVEGGAASNLPAPGSRKIYSNLVSGSLTAANNAFDSSNVLITDTMLNVTSDPDKSTLMNWVRGVDVRDQDSDGNVTEQRFRLGDPIHTRPVTVTYAAQAVDDDDDDEDGTVVFTATNEGMLHAVDANTGVELWSFLPKELMGRLKSLYNATSSTQHSYGIDGDIRLLKYDVLGDGAVDGDDKVYLFFGLRRGGSYYYGLDVTDKNNPSLLWVKGATDLPGLGQAWSTPTVARVKMQANLTKPASNAFADQHIVLIFGGGYTNNQENYSYSADTEGNALFMLDAQTGNLLWRAGTDAGANLQLNSSGNTMNNAIPSDVAVIDFDGDSFADRMYVGDMGGRIWRFDITSGAAPNSLVTGGVIARLGAADVSGATITDTRRFYNRADVSLVADRGSAPYFNIAIGSGYRGHPLHKATQDRFYGIRDFKPFTKLSQATYNTNAASALTNASLEDVTSDDESATVTASSLGWRFDLGASGAGEKVLAESTTIAGNTVFSSYTPPSATVLPCETNSFGSSRVYTVRTQDGAAINENRSESVVVEGIPSAVTVVLGDPAPDSTETRDTDGDGTPDILDNDDDDDGILDVDDDDIDGSASLDSDGDGIPNIFDDDNDNDDIKDKDDDDLDNDGVLNDVDDDMDGDGILNDEDLDKDGNGRPDTRNNGPTNELTTCWLGPMKLKQCVQPDSKVRTYWYKPAG